MSFLFSLLTGRVAGPGFAGLAALLALALAGGWTADHLRIAGLQRAVARGRTALSAAKADLSVCRASAASLEDGLARQNAAVQALAAAGVARAKAAAAAVEVARSQGRTDGAAAARALAARPGPDACASADRLILESMP